MPNSVRQRREVGIPHRLREPLLQSIQIRLHTHVFFITFHLFFIVTLHFTFIRSYVCAAGSYQRSDTTCLLFGFAPCEVGDSFPDCPAVHGNKPDGTGSMIQKKGKPRVVMTIVYNTKNRLSLSNMFSATHNTRIWAKQRWRWQKLEIIRILRALLFESQGRFSAFVI